MHLLLIVLLVYIALLALFPQSILNLTLAVAAAGAQLLQNLQLP